MSRPRLECVTRTLRSDDPQLRVARRAAQALVDRARRSFSTASFVYVTASGTSTGAPPRVAAGVERALGARAARRTATSASAVLSFQVMSAAWTSDEAALQARAVDLSRRAAASSTVRPGEVDAGGGDAGGDPLAGQRRRARRPGGADQGERRDGAARMARRRGGIALNVPRARGAVTPARRRAAAPSRPAVDRHVRAADDARSVLAEKAHDAGDLLRRDPAARGRRRASSGGWPACR